MRLPAYLCLLAPVPFLASLQIPGPADSKPASEPPRPRDTVTTLVSELPGGTGGLEVDAEGFIYSSDFGSKLGRGGQGGNLIFKIHPVTAEYEIFADVLRGASGNAIGPSGDFFQSNIGANSIYRITPEGEVSPFLKRELQGPVGIAIDEEGILFVANCNGQRVIEVSPEAEPLELCASPLFKCPNGIALDDDHNLYVANFGNGDVIKIDPGGEASKLATLPGNNNGHLVHREGFLYVVARTAHQIYRVSLEGEVELFAGSGTRGHTDGPRLKASFSYPNDLAFSPDGKILYVNENSRIEGPGTELAPVTVRAIHMPAITGE